jgi:hypothetical protein
MPNSAEVYFVMTNIQINDTDVGKQDCKFAVLTKLYQGERTQKSCGVWGLHVIQPQQGYQFRSHIAAIDRRHFE